MNLPSVNDLEVSGKRVFLRTDFDVPLKDGKVTDSSRIDEALPTIDLLLAHDAKIILLSHLGRPGGKKEASLSLLPVALYLSNLLGKRIPLVNTCEEISGQKEDVIMLENLRFFPGEEANSEQFAYALASRGEVYVNDAFACSHREHASIVGLPKFLPSAFGLDCLHEVSVLSEVRNAPRRPVVLVLGGAKGDKIEIAKRLSSWADWILIGGNLTSEGKNLSKKDKLIGELTPDGKDINEETINRFKEIIFQGKTIVWSGPMGVYEEKNSEKGTQKIAQAIIESKAYTVIGGGDTEAALEKFGLEKNVSYLSSGGGAMLEFLADGTLPGIEAIKGGKRHG